MKRIAAYQSEHREWVEKNFPSQPGWQPLLGLVEEVGELAHAHLKGAQGIRGHDEVVKNLKARVDAVGDIFIYLMSYCNAEGIDLEGCIDLTWSIVKRRNWVEDPEGGGQ